MIRWLINTMIASMIFFPVRDFSMRPSELGLSSEDVWCRTEDGLKLHGWFLHPEGRQEKTDLCLIFFHGNADNISIRLPKAGEWVKRGISVLLVDYRGYGQSEGNIKHGNDLVLDARAAYDWLRKEKGYEAPQLILYGESIGSVPVIELASKERFRAVILEAPFTSLKELAKHHYGWVPDFFLKDFVMDNESNVAHLKSPLFIIHGTSDEIAPISLGRRLFEKAPEPKKMFEVKGAHHNDVDSIAGNDFFEAPHQFIMAQKDTF